MPTLYTIGYQGKPLSEFIGSLRAAGVDAVIDVRLRNTSHLAGYTKKDTLAFLLTEGFGIAYEHIPDLAPSDDLLDTFRSTKSKDWTTYASRFLALMEERHTEDIGRAVLERYHSPCLLCLERKAEQCHRHLVAEYWAKHIPDLTITHL